MPLVQGRKRRVERDEDIESPEASPEPQTQRRRTQHASDDEEFDGGPSGAGTTQNETLNEMSKKLVRLALACEYQRKPIRRADISEKVLGANSRQFKQVWDKAQLDLETVFSMKMVEMPAREKLTMQQKRAAQKSASQAKSSSANWQLVSVLPTEFRSPQVVQPSAAPTAAEESTYTAIYTLLISFIRLSGGALPDVKMDNILKKLGMEDKTPVTGYEETEKLKKRLEKDAYLVKIKENTGTGEDDIYWVLGSRAKVEVGDQGVKGLVYRVYSDMKDPETEEELERKLTRSLGLSDQQQQANDVPPPTEKTRKRASKKKSNDEEDEDDEGEAEDGAQEDEDE